MKKYFFVILVLVLLLAIIYLIKVYQDYKLFKSEEFVKTSTVIYNISEAYFNNYFQYPQNGQQLLEYMKTDSLFYSIVGERLPKIIEKYGLGIKLIEDSVMTIYSYSFDKNDDWPKLIYNINELNFINFIFNNNDIFISEVKPPSNICDFLNRKLLLDIEDKRVENKNIEKNINQILLLTRIKYYSNFSENKNPLSIAYFEFTRVENDNIDLQVLCTSEFTYDEFKIELKDLMKEVMIKNNLKKVIYPMYVLN